MNEQTEDFPDSVTIGEKYEPAMKITDQADADAYFERCVRHAMRVWNKSREEVERIERENLAYYAGYFDNKTRARVERLFRCVHPIFGAIAEKATPTAQEAFEIGVEFARHKREERR